MEGRVVFKMLMLGDAGVGKTSLLERFANNRFSRNCICTVGVDSRQRNVEISGNQVKLQIWDTAGEERYRSMISCYYRHIHGIILVFDTTDRRSFQNVDYWLQEIQKHTAHRVHVLIVGNKCDMFEERQVRQRSAAIYAESLGYNYIEASAIDGTNVERVFYNLAVTIYETHMNRQFCECSVPYPHNLAAITLQQESDDPNNSCC